MTFSTYITPAENFQLLLGLNVFEIVIICSGINSDLTFFFSFFFLGGMIISAIHETRAPFIPTKWIKTEEANTNLDSDHDTHQVLKQVWFPGAHSDVGGGNGNLDLADISLVWMIVCQIHLISFFTASWFYITIFENMKAGVCISG